MGRCQFGYRSSTIQLDKRVNHNGENNGEDNDQRDDDSDIINHRNDGNCFEYRFVSADRLVEPHR